MRFRMTAFCRLYCNEQYGLPVLLLIYRLCILSVETFDVTERRYFGVETTV
jgi:hypothetical protein